MNIVISQPMFLPWLGLFEQVRLADVFVHYDDVQLPQGRSFMSRVQIKTEAGTAWLSAPVDRRRPGRGLISDTWLLDDQTWRSKHLKTLQWAYRKARFFEEMNDLAERIYAIPVLNLAEFNRHAIESIGSWLGLSPRFLRSSEMGIEGRSTQRLVDITSHLGGRTYITGQGAMNYLDYELFEKREIQVRYMKYEKRAYPQLHGDFTPFVSILDTIANCGAAARELLCSDAIYWKDYLDELS